MHSLAIDDPYQLLHRHVPPLPRLRALHADLDTEHISFLTY